MKIVGYDDHNDPIFEPEGEPCGYSIRAILLICLVLAGVLYLLVKVLS